MRRTRMMLGLVLVLSAAAVAVLTLRGGHDSNRAPQLKPVSAGRLDDADLMRRLQRRRLLTTTTAP